MLRDLRRNGAQPKDTMYKAGAALVVGMGIVAAAVVDENNLVIIAAVGKGTDHSLLKQMDRFLLVVAGDHKG